MGILGDRLPDQPTPQSALEEAEMWMDVLPPPPKPFSEQDEIDVEMWLRRIAEAGGIAGLQWCYRPDIWPYGSIMRGRLQHVVGGLLRKLDDEAKAKRAREADERAQQHRTDDREARRAKGWI